MRPAAVHTRRDVPMEPLLARTNDGVMNIPLPTMVPITIAMPTNGPIFFLSLMSGVTCGSEMSPLTFGLSGCSEVLGFGFSV